MRGIAIREELTDEWQNRGVKEDKEYEIFTLLNNFKFLKNNVLYLYFTV